MKAAILHKPKDLRIEQMPNPVSADDEVLVRVKAVGVCGSDVHWFSRGRIGETVLEDPLVLGHEAAGVIQQVGRNVHHLDVGTPVALEPGVPCRVCEACRTGNYNTCPHVRFFGTPPVHGCYREYVTHPADFVFPLPEHVTLGEGAMIEPLAVSVHAVDLAKVRTGYTVAVLGCGSIGLTAIALARISGASRIYATEPIEARRTAATVYGADVVLDPTQDDPVEQIMALTHGRGVDAVLEAAGAPDTPQQAVDVAKPCGTVALVGIPDEDQMVLRASRARRKGLTIRMVRRLKHTYPRAISLVEKGLVDVRPLITHRFDLDHIQEAFTLVEQYADGVIKALVEL